MPLQIYDWCYGKASATKSFVSNSFSSACSVISAPYHYLFNYDAASVNENDSHQLPSFDTCSDSVHFLSESTWLSDKSAPTSVQELKKPILSAALHAKLMFYLPQVLLYGLSRMLWRWGIPDAEESTAETVLDTLALGYFLAAAGGMVWDTAKIMTNEPSYQDSFPLFNWCYEKATAAKCYIQNSFNSAYSTISSAYNAVPSYHALSLNAKNVYNDLPTLLTANDLSQFIYGLHCPIDGAVAETFLKGPKTRRVFGYALYANLLFYLPRILAYSWSKMVLQWSVKKLSPLSPWDIPDFENSSAEAVLDWLGWCYLLSVAGRMFLANSLFNLDAAKTVAEEHPNREYFPPCICDRKTIRTMSDGRFVRGKIAQVQGMLASPFYYISNMSIVWVISLIPRAGFYFALPLKAQAYGYAFLEPNYRGMCTQHRYEELAKKNAYAFGIGVAFLISQYVTIEAIRFGSGVENGFIEDAVFSLGYLYFVIAALSINRTIPGNERGRDIFSFSRHSMEWIIDKLAYFVGGLLENPAKPSRWVERMGWLWSTRPIQWVKNLVTGPYQNLESFSKTPEARLTLELQKKDIDEGIDWFKKLRATKIVSGLESMFEKAKPYIPNQWRSPDIEKVVKVSLDKQLDPWLTSITTTLMKMDNWSKPLDDNPIKIDGNLPLIPWEIKDEHETPPATINVRINPIPQATKKKLNLRLEKNEVDEIDEEANQFTIINVDRWNRQAKASTHEGDSSNLTSHSIFLITKNPRETESLQRRKVQLTVIPSHRV